MWSWLSWDTLCRLGWPQTQKPIRLCLPSGDIKGVNPILLPRLLNAFLFLLSPKETHTKTRMRECRQTLNSGRFSLLYQGLGW